MSNLKRSIPWLLLAVACAQVQAPPGGPPDHSAPVLLSTYPDSLVVLPGFKGWVEFRFDEVIKDEGSNFGTGSGPLEKLVLMSPDTLVPKVVWDRDKIRVQPRRGWRPNTVYRIELAPGISDLRGNVSKTSHVITFATGGEFPTRYVTIRAVDWMQRTAVPGALVEAITIADSQVYRAIADSTGRLWQRDSIGHRPTFGPLPNVAMWIRVVLDKNNNHRLDPGESWDTLRLAPDQNAAGEIWAFPRDTLPAHHVASSRKDSVTILVQVDHPIDPMLMLPAESIGVFLITGLDSADVGPVSAMPLAMYDSLQKLRAPPKVDSIPPPPPPATPDVKQDLPYTRKPIIGMAIMVQIRGRLEWEKTYKVVLHGVRTVSGIVGTVYGTPFKTPKEPAKPAIKPAAKPDSLSGGRGGG